eukprot:925602-Lingulodinium_polyedra.AAC.1
MKEPPRVTRRRRPRGLHWWTALEPWPRRPRTVNPARFGQAGPRVQTTNKSVLNVGRWFNGTVNWLPVYAILDNAVETPPFLS